MSDLKKAKELLTQYWGFSSFREKQEDIISSILDQRDTLALLPTGGGKSLCFQIPALCKDGICIVVTPLIALMQDQVYQLKSRGINALAVHSGMSKREIDITLDNAAYGNYKFLYVSPERLQTDLFKARLEKMNVNLIAVDEAHCVSQWGYDFRPSYLQIAEIKRIKADVPIIALTATATPKVADDIQEKLLFKEKNLIQKSFLRENLAYVVLKEEVPLKRMIKVIEGVKGSGIVYVNSRKKTKEIAEYLNRNNISAKYFHAGLDYKERSEIQSSWIRNKVQVIVATNAFGMGIDKSHVRFVIHLSIPSSIEAYFQEAGRAGRDGKKAYAVLLPTTSALIDLEEFVKKKFPPISYIKNVYEALANHLQIPIDGGLNHTVDIDLNEFSNKYNFDRIECYHSLQLLSRDNYIDLNEFNASEAKAMMIMNKEDIYKFQVAHQTFDSFIKLLLRSYGGLFENFSIIDEIQLAKRFNSSISKIISLLKKLKEYEVLEYREASNMPKITFTKPRLRKEELVISKENYQDRKKTNELQLKAISSYVNSNIKCRSIQLLEYFGERNLYRCGICDTCLDRKKLPLNDIEFEEIRNQLTLLLEQSKTIEDLIAEVRGYKKDKILEVVHFLINHGEIKTDGNSLFLN